MQASCNSLSIICLYQHNYILSFVNPERRRDISEKTVADFCACGGEHLVAQRRKRYIPSLLRVAATAAREAYSFSYWRPLELNGAIIRVAPSAENFAFGTTSPRTRDKCVRLVRATMYTRTVRSLLSRRYNPHEFASQIPTLPKSSRDVRNSKLLCQWCYVCASQRISAKYGLQVL